MPRTEEDYGLPPLSFDEAARVLGLDKGALMNWVMEQLSPSPTQWSLWKSGTRPLPEALIRLYLTHRGEIESSYQRELRELKEAVQKIAATEAAAAATRRRQKVRKAS